MSFDVTADLLARLGGLGVPVLRPEQFEDPNTGGGPSQTRGLSAYLLAHPEGYIQLHDTDGSTTNGNVNVGLLLIDVIAPDRAKASVLTTACIALLHGIPVRPTPYMLYTDARIVPINDLAVRATLMFETHSFIPQGGN